MDEKYTGEEDSTDGPRHSWPRLKDEYSVRGSVEFGYRLTQRTFIVANAGLTKDEYNLRYTTSIDSNLGDSVSTDTTFKLNGYVLGVGIERYLTQHIIGSISYQEVRHNTKNKDMLHAVDSSLDEFEPRTVGVTPADHIVSVAIMAQL
ncbi:MAG: hypothetical protein GY821_09440 [Gammaproteobacteria bacterium]|nr:hypothetical protein [Gammaproteobacteria bacterium]